MEKERGVQKKKIKSHTTPPRCLAGPGCAGMRTCPSPPTPGMQKLAPWQGPRFPSTAPGAPSEASGTQSPGSPPGLEQHQARRRAGGWAGTAQPPRREADAPHRGRAAGRVRRAGHRTALAHAHPRGPAEIMAKSGFFSATLGPLASSQRAWAEL